VSVRIARAGIRTRAVRTALIVWTALASGATSATAHPTLSREDILVWIEPDQSPAFGVFDWSRYQRTVTPAGAPAFETDHLALDGINDHLLIADALDPSALAAEGFTILIVFQCPTSIDEGRFFFSLRADNGATFTDCAAGTDRSVIGRCSTDESDGAASTATGPGATRLPELGSDPPQQADVYLAALRWDPSASGTVRVSLAHAGDDASTIAATTGSETGIGAPDAGTSDLYIACRGDTTPTAFGAWDLVRAACIDRALTDEELAAMVPADGAVPSFTDLMLTDAEGFIDHADPARLSATQFQDAIWLALTRNVHIVIGPGESHCGSGALTAGSVPGLDNILKHACGRAVGLAGCGLTSFDVLPLTPATFSSVHHLPFNTSDLAPAWAATNGTLEPTTGLWDTLGDPSVRRSTPHPGPRSIAHLQRQAIVEANKSTAGIDAMTGMVNPWTQFAAERFDLLSVYANSDNATGAYRIAGLIEGGSYGAIADWTADGPALTIPPDAALSVQRFPLDPTWDGFAIENIGGVGEGLRMGFFDARSPDPGVRIGCTGLAIGGGRVPQVNQQVWFPLIDAAQIDYLGLCPSITNDSSKGTPMSAWWHDTQTIIRGTVARTGPDGAGGSARGHGIWIPAEGNLLPVNKVRQRLRADLLASLAVELGVDLISFPAFVPTHESGATVLYNGVHISSARFGTVARYFELNVMPWAVPEPTGACCFSCAESPAAPCPSPVPFGPPCVDGISREECEQIVQGVYRGDGAVCEDVEAGPLCLCIGDISADGRTNASDFVILAGAFGTGAPACASRAQGDLNCDGVVNAADFVILAGDFGCQ
jgi:hypothetical protein